MISTTIKKSPIVSLKSIFLLFIVMSESISANLDNLTNMLNELHYPFTIVGLTETKLNISKDSIDNIDLPGYQFLSQPSLSNAGGAGIFVQDFVKVSIRPELTKSEPGFEAL